MLQIGLIASLFVWANLGKWEINAVMTRRDSNCIGIVNEGVAATASNLSEYTMLAF